MAGYTVTTEHLRLTAGFAKKRERNTNDAYYTPSKPVRIVLHELRDEIALLDGPVIEPSAGGGSFVRELVGFASVDPGRITAVDIDKTALASCKRETPGIRTHVGDFLSWRPSLQPALIIGNPPYKDDLPERFVRHAFSLRIKRPWMMAFLLRLNWLGSQGRAALHRQYPSDVLVLPERPSFTGDRATDMTEYAFFVWRSWRPGGRVVLLPTHDPAQGVLDLGG